MAQLRGLVTFQGILYAVRGDTLISVDSAGVATTIGTIGSAGGALDFAQNLTQLAICDGATMYVWDGTTLAQNTNFEPGDRIGVVDQRLVAIQLNSQRFSYYPLADMLAEPEGFYSAEAVPDNLVAMCIVYGEVFLLGEWGGEIWSSVGGTDVFQRNKGAYIEHGCAAAHSLQLVGGSCMWLTRNQRGQASVMQLNGYQSVAVSTRSIEERFDKLDLSGARAYVRQEGKRESYYLNVPGVNTTLVYDTMFKQWHEEAELVNGEYERFRAVCAAFAYGRHYIGANDGIIYRVDRDINTFAGDPKCRERTSPVISQPGRKTLSFPSFEIVCQKGTNGTVMLRYSDDNGETYKGWHYASAGATGEYRQRVIFRRLTSAKTYDRIYTVRMTDDSPWNPVTVNVEIV